MQISDVAAWLAAKYPGNGVYAAAVPRNEERCIGIFGKERGSPALAMGGTANASYAVLPVDILIHWTEDAGACETEADTLYALMLGNTSEKIGGENVVRFELLDAAPADIGRDTHGICEMSVRVNIDYER